MKERLLCLIIGYGCGLLQTGYLLGELRGIDIRKHGSGNAGTTNMLRTLGPLWGLLTLLGDFLKCFVAVLIVTRLFGESHAQLLPVLKMYAGLGVTLGHDYPFYMKWKGGKGVAVAGALAIAFDPLLALPVFGVFLLLFFTTHYVSLGSLAAFATFTLLALIAGLRGNFDLTGPQFAELMALVLLMTGLAYWKHRANIRRLLSGTERRTYIHGQGHEHS